jgi:hypothetical protein
MRNHHLVVATTVFLSGLVIAPSAAVAQKELCGPFPVGQDVYACTCTPDAAVGDVWGSGPYTSDSMICSAAYHAGVIGLDGGNVVAIETGPQEFFTGTEANGMVSADWGPYPNSFVFDAPVSPFVADLGDLETCGIMPEEYEIYQCRCDMAAMAGGPVWGSLPYTADSNICRAALHAGNIGPEGGIVLVARVNGMESYEGSAMNGVVSEAWGPYPSSIVFEYIE